LLGFEQLLAENALFFQLALPLFFLLSLSEKLLVKPNLF
jgi:hypothetical protein